MQERYVQFIKARHHINCHIEEFTARDDKPTKEDEFKDDNDDCSPQGTTSLPKKTSLKMTTMTVATKNSLQGTTSLPKKTSSKMTTTTVVTNNPPQGATSLPKKTSSKMHNTQRHF
jgi:hypothetical protein